MIHNRFSDPQGSVNRQLGGDLGEKRAFGVSSVDGKAGSASQRWPETLDSEAGDVDSS
jgi:hypothetical protein